MKQDSDAVLSPKKSFIVLVTRD